MLSKTWREAVIEGGMVLLGVLLALLVDEWREDREFRQLVEITENQVLEEIRSNNQRLNEYHLDFQARREQLGLWGEGLDVSQGILYQTENFPGIPGTFLNRSAWTMANNSQLTEFINYEFYDGAYQLYSLGQSLEERLGVMAGVIYNVQSFDPNYTDAIYRVIAAYFDDIIENLNSLARDHALFLESPSM